MELSTFGMAPWGVAELNCLPTGSFTQMSSPDSSSDEYLFAKCGWRLRDDFVMLSMRKAQKAMT